MRRFGAEIIVSLLLSGAARANAQSADSPARFESITIKPGSSTPGAYGWGWTPLEECIGGPGTPDPRNLKCNISVAKLLFMAYGLSPSQFTPPVWMKGTGF